MRQQEEPAEMAARLEAGALVPAEAGGHLVGYSVMGVPFAGGDVLALRRFPATSLGPSYTSVWHRDPNGHWTFYSDVPADQGCSAYWRPLLERTVVAPIRLEWTGPRQLAVSVDSGRLVAWSLTVDRTVMSAALTRLAGRLPAAWWLRPVVARIVGAAAGVVLGTGRLTLHARTPSGHALAARPRIIRMVTSSRATVHGRDLGTPAALRPRAHLGEFAIPQRGIFAVGVVTLREAQS